MSNATRGVRHASSAPLFVLMNGAKKSTVQRIVCVAALCIAVSCAHDPRENSAPTIALVASDRESFIVDQLADDNVLIISVAVHDADGLEDIDRGVLVDDLTATEYGAFLPTDDSSSAFEISLDPVAVMQAHASVWAEDRNLTLRARFWDLAGHVAEKTISIPLACSGEHDAPTTRGCETHCYVGQSCEAQSPTGSGLIWQRCTIETCNADGAHRVRIGGYGQAQARTCEALCGAWAFGCVAPGMFYSECTDSGFGMDVGDGMGCNDALTYENVHATFPAFSEQCGSDDVRSYRIECICQM